MQDCCKQMLVLSCAWAFGYLGMWGCKWVMATLLSDQNVIANALQNAAYRMGTSTGAWEGSKAFTVKDVIYNNFRAATEGPIRWLEVLIGCCMLYWLVAHRAVLKYHAQKTVPLIMCAGIPLIWYVLVSNHSWVHTWMAYRDLGVMVFAGLCAWGYLDETASH